MENFIILLLVSQSSVGTYDTQLSNPTPLTLVITERTPISPETEKELCEIAAVRIAEQLDSIIPDRSKILLLWEENKAVPAVMAVSFEHALVREGIPVVQRGKILFDERTVTLESRDTVSIAVALKEDSGKMFTFATSYQMKFSAADYILLVQPLEYSYKRKKDVSYSMWFKASFSLINARTYIKEWGGFIAYERQTAEEVAEKPPTQPKVTKKAPPQPAPSGQACTMSSSNIAAIAFITVAVFGLLVILLAQ